MKRLVSGIMLTLLLISMLTLTLNVLPVKSSNPDVLFFDDFNDNTINLFMWSPWQSGGVTIAEANQRLEIFFPYDSSGVVFSGSIHSNCWLRGDFDIQADFYLLEWPSIDQLGTGNGVRMGLSVAGDSQDWGVTRTSFGTSMDFPDYPREVCLFDSTVGQLKGMTSTSDMSGILRIVRSGNIVNAYYFNSTVNDWVFIASEYVMTGDVRFTLAAWSHDYAFMNCNVKLAFDNFLVNSGILICPKISVTTDIDPDTLNLRSRGQWITAYIELPEGYDVNDINVSTIMLNDTVPAELKPFAIGDYDSDTVPDLMVKFDRAEVISYILANVDLTQLYEDRFMTITLTITGYLNDGTPFQGSTTIRIVMPMPRGLYRIFPI